MHGQPK